MDALYEWDEDTVGSRAGFGSEGDSEEGSSDTESMQESLEEPIQEPIETPKETPVPVVEFSYEFKKNTNPKHEYKQFMSSKVSSIFKPITTTKQEKEEDDEDDRNDREIVDMMQANQLVTQYTKSELTGKDKKRYLTLQIQELSGITPKIKTSLPMHLGLKKKAHERVEKKIRDAKNIGIYTSTLGNEFIRNEKTLKSSLDVKKEKLDVGIVGSIGKYSSKKGVMTVSKKMIHQIENQGKSGKPGKSKFKKRAVSLKGTSLGGQGNKKSHSKSHAKISF